MTDDEAVAEFLHSLEALARRGVVSAVRDNPNAIDPLLCRRVKAISSRGPEVEDFWLHNLADATEALLAIRSIQPVDHIQDADRRMSPLVHKDLPPIADALFIDWARVWCGWQILAGGTGPITTEEVKAGLSAVADEARAKIQDYEAGRITAKDYREFMNRVHKQVASSRPVPEESQGRADTKSDAG